ncbi:NAD(+) diphosphatase [Vibrio sp.]|nr:NAD(+) diphosphatase [Vibrio sp.]
MKHHTIKNDTVCYWCIVSGNGIYLENNELPKRSAQSLQLSIDAVTVIDEYLDCPVVWLNDSEIEKQLDFTSLREMLLAPAELFSLMSKAVQYSHMSQTQRFCSCCGGRTYLNQIDMAMQCHECRQLHYPRISPCIIVAIVRDEHILLVQNKRHKSNTHTVVAGFVEVGETLEQTVHREVSEEVGVQINNIRYFGSQTWAFPSNLMVGFIADYSGGELVIDQFELKKAAWYHYTDLPDIAPKGTIAYELIQAAILEAKS